MNWQVRHLATLVCSMGMIPGLVLASVGDLDPSYGDGGHAVIQEPVGTLGDGSLIYAIPGNVAGSTDFARTDINGHADTLFGGSGRLTLPVDDLVVDGPQAPPLRTPTGQLLFAIRQAGQVGLLGLDSTGHPDPSFGTAGILNVAPISSNCPNDRIEGLAFQPDGHLLTLVSDYGDGYTDQVLLSMAIRRFNANGSLDPTFGNGSGVVASTFASCNSGLGGAEGAATLNVLQDGAMDVFLPTMRSYFSATGARLGGPPLNPGLPEWRYVGTLPNGDQLLTYGATPPNSSSPSSGASPDGAPSQIVIALVHPDGTFVSSFGGAGTGYAKLDIGALVSSETGIAESLQTIRISSDGQHIYMAILLLRQCAVHSYCSNGGTLGLVIARLLAQGSQAGTLDQSFGNGGIVVIGKAAVLNIVDIVEQPGGAVVLTTGGSAIRLLGDGTPSQGVVGAAGDYFWVPVSQDTAQVRVARTLGKNGAVSVNYATNVASSGEPAAVAGTDYTAVSGRLDWADGDFADKIIQIPVVHNSGTSASRILTVRLTAPTGGPWIIWGNPTVYIDSAPSSTPTATPTMATASSATVGTTSSATGGGGALGPWSIGLLSLSCLMTLTRRRRAPTLDSRIPRSSGENR